MSPRKAPIVSSRNAKAETKSAQVPSLGLLDMDQAIEMLKTTRPTFYRWLRAGNIKGMKVGRQWRFNREDLLRFVKGQAPAIELPVDIKPLLAALRARLAETGGKPPTAAPESPLSEAVNLMMSAAAAAHASDIHIEPQAGTGSEGNIAVIRHRVDGVLHELARFDIRLLPPLVERIKQMCAMDVRERAKPQDGRMLLSVEGRTLDLRVCVLPACIGEAVTMRILSREEVKLSIDRLGYGPSDRGKLDRALAAPSGLIVVAGPMGSGKTTALYAFLLQTAKPGIKVITVEDPVEFLLPGMTQVQVNYGAGMTFPYALRAIMRSDPDVVMLGEIRDLPTLEGCLVTAITGHLVMTTLHTDDGASTLRRMVDIGAEPFVVASSMRLVVSQRLVRILCPDCSVPADPPAAMLAQAEQIARTGGLGWDGLPRNFRKAVGCPRCGGGHGYRGRTTICEMMEMSGELGAALRRGAPVEELRTIAIGQGMTTLAADGVRRAAEGRTTLEEVFRVVPGRMLG